MPAVHRIGFTELSGREDAGAQSQEDKRVKYGRAMEMRKTCADSRQLVHAWGHDWLEAEEQRPLSGLALELMADATRKEEVDSSQRLRLVPHVMACFGVFSRVDLSSGEVGRDDLAMIDRIEGFLYRIWRGVRNI